MTDYYLLPLHSHVGRCVVESAQATINLSFNDWSHLDALQNTITRYATGAPHSEWGILGCRAHETRSQIFQYSKSAMSQEAITLMVWWAISIACIFIEKFVSRQEWASIVEECASLPAMALLVTTIFTGQILDIHRRRSQRIETSPAGLTFTDHERTISVSWSDVEEYEYTHHGWPVKTRIVYQVRTTAGNFDFTPSIKDWMLLNAIIRHWAPPASLIASEAETGALGGESARWTGGAPGVGDRVFHYRTRINRMGLWLPSILTIILPFAYEIAKWAQTPNSSSPLSPAILYSICVVITLWGWWRFYSARIVINDTGILERSIFGPRRMFWSEVTSITRSSDIVTLHADDQKVRYWCTIADFDGLNAAIERHTSLHVPETMKKRN
ncbi:hypothetical protein CCAX7_009190 [Capsulimonas corticalis]|uniref:Uncharacterized protein n=1 Tax=Capsulimonas corticalis TaxID=2219043 RepID=A0A402CU53_9BACT|nr:hypothetical protein CCAX7_009190 [Capsulimonas corticalis]